MIDICGTVHMWANQCTSKSHQPSKLYKPTLLFPRLQLSHTMINCDLSYPKRMAHDPHTMIPVTYINLHPILDICKTYIQIHTHLHT